MNFVLLYFFAVYAVIHFNSLPYTILNNVRVFVSAEFLWNLP